MSCEMLYKGYSISKGDKTNLEVLVSDVSAYLVSTQCLVAQVIAFLVWTEQSVNFDFFFLINSQSFGRKSNKLLFSNGLSTSFPGTVPLKCKRTYCKRTLDSLGPSPQNKQGSGQQLPFIWTRHESGDTPNKSNTACEQTSQKEGVNWEWFLLLCVYKSFLFLSWPCVWI